MRKNLDGSGETFVAEPLYIALGLGRVANAYDLVKSLSDRARDGKTTLGGVIRRDGWPGEIPAQVEESRLKALQEILDFPERYAGIAERVALDTCSHWEDASARLESRIRNA
jgi:hypothetical protein